MNLSEDEGVVREHRLDAVDEAAERLQAFYFTRTYGSVSMEKDEVVVVCGRRVRKGQVWFSRVGSVVG